ncbi:hypothetical protein PACTADRAFT_48210 [Pachysolen tannophilus NRRL Y-2460]|uniref:DNA-directed RNA polymerase III subunit n=1 Tax=Pachysolen tannophilus NRRL Y-2460 TaxID=669874 RepID=A0A1E4U3G6_PACTA|nr:hypothetical protein PACTADRAFT_48210 [Pachysolen tannophilus NRRL Y-2460]
MNKRRTGAFNRALLPFGLEYNDVNSPHFEEESSKLTIPIDGPSTNAEKESAKQSIKFQNILKNGPFYTGSLQSAAINVQNNNNKVNKKSQIIYNDQDGINDGIKRYSDRHRQKRKIGRSIDEHPYVIEFFPEELYTVMGIDNKRKKKLLSLSNYSKNLEQDDRLILLEKTKKINEKLENLKNISDETSINASAGIGGASNQEDEDVEDEDAAAEEDDEFEEEDDDDYNAEKYFDDGDDVYGDDDEDDNEAAF